MSVQVGQRVTFSASGKVVCVSENGTYCSISAGDDIVRVKCASVALVPFQTGEIVYAVSASDVAPQRVGVVGCVLCVWHDTGRVTVAYGDNLVRGTVDKDFVVETDAANLRLCDTLPALTVGQLVAIDKEYLETLDRAAIPATVPRMFVGQLARVTSTSVEPNRVMVEFLNGGVAPARQKLRREWLRFATDAECAAQKTKDLVLLQTGLQERMSTLQQQMSAAVEAYAQLANGECAPAQALLEK